jgi:hypothetical protein
MGYADFHLSAVNMSLMELMGVRFYLIGDRHAARQLAAFPELRTRWKPLLKRDGVTLYEDARAMPRAFLATRVELQPDPDLMLERMRDSDLGSVAFVEEPIDLGTDASAPAGGGTAEISAYEANRVVIETESTGRALLVLTDQHDDGWRATIDGSDAPIHRTDFLFRGVVVPAGRHTVELTYRPASFVAGALLSVVGSALAAGLAFLGGRTGRWPS